MFEKYINERLYGKYLFSQPYKAGYRISIFLTYNQPQFDEELQELGFSATLNYKDCLKIKNNIEQHYKEVQAIEKKKEENRKQELERKRQWEQMVSWRNAGLCQYCGGKIKGILVKKCCNCGREKDYF